jgi:hypothetical protein
MSQHCYNMTGRELTDGVREASFWRLAKTEKGTIGSHMHCEAVQVHHVTADPVNTEEWRTMTERLKRHDRIHLRPQRFVSGEQLRQPRDSQTAGQHVNSEVSAEPGFDGGEQAKQRERITPKVEKVGSDTNR